MELNNLVKGLIEVVLGIFIIEILIKLLIGTILGILMLFLISSFSPGFPWYINAIAFVGGFFIGVRIASGILGIFGKLFKVI